MFDGPHGVTTVPCTCGHMEEIARLFPTAIDYDPEWDEYTFVFPYPHGPGNAELRIFHCILCGGRLPPSKRPS